jgi:hypothetical protein
MNTMIASQLNLYEVNANLIIEYLTAEQEKDMRGRRRMEIEIACGFLHNDWNAAIAYIGDRLERVPGRQANEMRYILRPE